MAVDKIDPKIIFASEAPSQDIPAVFLNKTIGWGETRKNGGRPTIKQGNALQQENDLKILWLNENSVTPYDSTIDYPVNAVTIKDGDFKIFNGSIWNLFLNKNSIGLGNVDNTSDLNKPISDAQKVVNKLGGVDYWDGGTYPLNGEVRLANGDVVKSTIPNNTSDPNIDMTGWGKGVRAREVADASGKDQQEINDRLAYMTNMRLHVSFFGVVGDEVADDTQALENAINFVESNNIRHLDTSDMSMRCTRTINISKPIFFGGNNSTIIADHSNTALRCYPNTLNKNFFQEAQNLNLGLNIGTKRVSYVDSATAKGIEIWNCHGGIFRIQTMLSHYDALCLRADSGQGLTYCEFHLGAFRGCTGGILLQEDYSTGGWVTENTFFKGSLGGGSSSLPMRYHVSINGAARSHNNNNVFISTSFEGWMTKGIIARNTTHNAFIHCRYEMPYATHFWDFDSTCQAMTINGGYGVDYAIKNKLYIDTSYYSTITADGYEVGGRIELINGTLFEYVADQRGGIAATTDRPRVSIGLKTRRNITHSTDGTLTLDLSLADVYNITASANITSIAFTNGNLVQHNETKIINVSQAAANLSIQLFDVTALGNFRNPLSILNSIETYTLRSVNGTIVVVGHNTRATMNPVLSHNTLGVLTLNINSGQSITINANADITAMPLTQAANFKVGDKRTIVFNQNASGVTINAFTPAQLGDKSNPVARPNGVDVYELTRLQSSGAIVCLSHYAS